MAKSTPNPQWECAGLNPVIKTQFAIHKKRKHFIIISLNSIMDKNKLLKWRKRFEWKLWVFNPLLTSRSCAWGNVQFYVKFELRPPAGENPDLPDQGSNKSVVKNPQRIRGRLTCHCGQSKSISGPAQHREGKGRGGVALEQNESTKRSWVADGIDGKLFTQITLNLSESRSRVAPVWNVLFPCNA